MRYLTDLNRSVRLWKPFPSFSLLETKQHLVYLTTYLPWAASDELFGNMVSLNCEATAVLMMLSNILISWPSWSSYRGRWDSALLWSPTDARNGRQGKKSARRRSCLKHSNSINRMRNVPCDLPRIPSRFMIVHGVSQIARRRFTSILELM